MAGLKLLSKRPDCPEVLPVLGIPGDWKSWAKATEVVIPKRETKKIGNEFMVRVLGVEPRPYPPSK